MGQAKIRRQQQANVTNPAYDLAHSNQSYWFTLALERRFKPAVVTTKVNHPGSGINTCNLNVISYCKAHGGTVVHGWIIDDNPPDAREYSESSAREHFVVLTDSGEYVDPTPYPLNGDRSVFIPTGSKFTDDEIANYCFRSSVMYYEPQARAAGVCVPTGRLVWAPDLDNNSIVRLYNSVDKRLADEIMLDETYYYRSSIVRLSATV